MLSFPVGPWSGFEDGKVAGRIKVRVFSSFCIIVTWGSIRIWLGGNEGREYGTMDGGF